MVNFRQIERKIRDTERIVGIIRDRETKEDKNIIGICYSEIDELQRIQEELKPLIDSLGDYTERMVLTLRYLRGYSCPWIAEKMGICRASVYNHLNRGKRKLIERYPDRIEQ